MGLTRVSQVVDDEQGFVALSANLIYSTLTVVVLAGFIMFVSSNKPTDMPVLVSETNTPVPSLALPSPSSSPTPPLEQDWAAKDLEIGRKVIQQQVDQGEEMPCGCGDVVKKMRVEDCLKVTCCLLGGTYEFLSADECRQRQAANQPNPSPNARPTIDPQTIEQLRQQLADIKARAFDACAAPIYKKYNCSIGGKSTTSNAYCLGETAESRTRMYAELEKCR